MKSVFGWFISAILVMFWIFRVVVAILATFNVEFIITPSDMNLEIALIFLTLPCVILIFRRKIWGGIALFGLYAWYFGTTLVETVQNILVNNVEIVSMSESMNSIVAMFAIIISLANLIDMLLTRFSKNENPSKKADWFYKNEAYDRQLDERSDKNNYRIY